MRAVIYCRDSMKEQALKLSLPAELKAIQADYGREGFDVAEVFEDAADTATETGG
jgi:DNA invertase Pin-like site-specific DNA recombinase